MSDWAATAAGVATAAGTLVLAGATFSSIRSAQRSARATEAALLASIRPVLFPSALEDPVQKVGFIDGHWVRLPGGRAVVDADGDTAYLAVSLRNAGAGIAVLDRWRVVPGVLRDEVAAHEVDGFRRLIRDLWLPPGQIGFWQGAIRDAGDPLRDQIREAARTGETITLDLLYGDHDGGQRTVTRFGLRPVDEGDWLVTVARHWNLDRPDPR